MDKDLATRFVEMLLGVLRGEIAEASARAQRLADAAAHNRMAREEAQGLLAKVQAQRHARERHLMSNVTGTEG